MISALSAAMQVFVSRAVRYNVQVPIRYRRAGEAAWMAGATRNISTTGVLFAAETALPAGSMLELNISLPQFAEHARRPAVVGSGRVVRAMHAPAPQESLLAADMFEIKFASEELSSGATARG